MSDSEGPDPGPLEARASNAPSRTSQQDHMTTTKSFGNNTVCCTLYVFKLNHVMYAAHQLARRRTQCFYMHVWFFLFFFYFLQLLFQQGGSIS